MDPAHGTITPTGLSRAAALAAVTAGLLFIAVQVAHPDVDIALVTTAQWKVRQAVKVAMATSALVGIAGIYLRQVRQAGILGLAGFVLLELGFLLMLVTEVVGLVLIPTIAATAPGYVSDVLAVANGGTAVGDIGLMGPLSLLAGAGYVLGGVVFGIAVFRARVLTRWAAALLALATASSLLIPLLPQVNQRLFAVPTGIALVALGWSLWRDHRPVAPLTTARTGSSPVLDPAGSR